MQRTCELARAARKLLVPLALFSLGAVGFAQDEGGGEGAEGQEAEPEKAADENKAKYFAIVGADVHTGTGAVLRGATILARNGKIAEIGYDVFVPESAERLDARGLRVYPGFIALGATSRVTTGTLAAESPDAGASEPEAELQWDGLLPVVVPDPADGGELSGHVTFGEDDHDHDGHDGGSDDLQAEDDSGGGEPKSEIEDTFDPFNSYLVLALATGITTVQQTTAAVKLKRYEIDGVLLSDRYLASVPWDLSNPTGIKGTRDKFAKAAQYVRDMRAWRERNDKNEKEPSRRGVDTTARRILSGEALAHFRASRREELLGIARFAQEFGFRPVIEGCEEGWTVADELGRAGAYAVLTPRRRLPKDEQLVRPGGASIENAAILHKSGVQVAVRPDSTSIDQIGTAGRDLLHLPVEAGFAVRGGLSDAAALQAMTLVPARILGIDHRVGSLEVGKDLDAIVTDGDVLHYQTFVQYAVVDGKLVYDKEDEIYFAHIRPRPKRTEEPAATAEEPATEGEEPAQEEASEDAGEEEEPGDEPPAPEDEESGDEDG